MKSRRHKHKKAGHRLVWRIEAFALRIFMALAGRLPVGLMGPVASFLTQTAGRLPIRREVLRENLKIAFGPLSEQEETRIVRGVVRHSILLIFEFARLQRLDAAAIAAAVEVPPEEQQRIDAIFAEAGGVIIGTAHFGNWEWSGAWTAAISGRTFGAVYKPMHNPWTDAMLARGREKVNVKLFSTQDITARPLIRFLRGGGVLGMLSDQDARTRGEFIPFFGQPASTAVGLAQIAVRQDVPLVFGFLQRKGPCHFRMRLFFPENPAGDEKQAARELMKEYYRALETVIREAPEQYFWWHRRWKTQPKRKERA